MRSASAKLKAGTVVTLGVLLLGSPAVGQDSEWTFLLPPFHNGYLAAVDFLDPDTGWAVGVDDASGAVILRTTDSGDSWQVSAFPEIIELTAVSFVDANLGYAGGRDAVAGVKILRTTNGGTDWAEQGVPDLPEATLRGLDVVDATTGWAVGSTPSQTLVLRTIDGMSWEQVPHPQRPGELRAVSFADSLRVWAVGRDDAAGGPLILASVDGGFTWAEQPTCASTASAFAPRSSGETSSATPAPPRRWKWVPTTRACSGSSTPRTGRCWSRCSTAAASTAATGCSRRRPPTSSTPCG